MSLEHERTGMLLARARSMQASSPVHVAKKLRRGRYAPFTREHPVIRARKTTALALTLFTVALGFVIGIRWGTWGLACYLPWLPFALLLLWVGTTALRFDERGESADQDIEIAPRPIELFEHAVEQT